MDKSAWEKFYERSGVDPYRATLDEEREMLIQRLAIVEDRREGKRVQIDRVANDVNAHTSQFRARRRTYESQLEMLETEEVRIRERLWNLGWTEPAFVDPSLPEPLLVSPYGA